MPELKQTGVSGRKKKPVVKTVESDRIVFFTRDQEGNIYGMVSLHRNNVLDVTYSAIEHSMTLTLKGNFGNLESRYEPCQNVKVETVNNVKKKLPQNSYTMQVLTFGNTYNPSMSLKDEAEMEKCWRWLKHDDDEMSWEAIMSIRQAVVERVAKAKEEEEKKLQEKKAEAEANGGIKTEEEIMEEAMEQAGKDASASKIVDMHGAKIDKSTIES